MDAAYEHFMREWGTTPANARAEMVRRQEYYTKVNNKKMVAHYREWLEYFDKKHDNSRIK